MKTVIGIDFGTLSARAVLVSAEDGAILENVSLRYPRGVLPGDLVCIDDYDETLDALLRAVAKPEYRDSVCGICVDATSLTLVCLAADGTPVEKLPGFSGREQARVKLWKCHHAEPQAQEALRLAREMNEAFLGRTGGTISSEWTLPKLLDMRDNAPEVYARTDLAFDLCEYLTYRLTGQLVRSVGSMCYKGLWAEDLTFPSDAFLNRLRPGFAAEYRHLLRGPVGLPGQKAGCLKAELCREYGLRPDVAVAVGLLDGHTAQTALGALQAGDAALVAGTSNVLSIQTDALRDVPGICGIAMNGQVPGLCGLDTGQSCTGDMLAWYVDNALPASVVQEAADRGISVHTLLSERIAEPWNCPLTAADWWNGSRNAPCDLTLRGFIHGLSVNTKPEEMYLALLQSIACGTREIVEQCERSGVTVRRFLATGGVTWKNPLLMQQYADLLNRPVCVGRVAEGPALGSAIFAAVAAGLYSDVAAAHQRMGVSDFTVYEPDAQHRAQYEQIYQRSHRLRQLTAALEKEDAHERA